MEQDIQNPSKQTASEILSDSVKGKYNFFFHFSKPYTDAIDNGAFFQKPVSWIYTLIGGVFLLAPLVLAVKAIDNNFFDAPSKFIFIGLLFWAVITLVCLINFQIWINRKNKLLKLDGSKGFLATTIMSNIISTTGECYGVAVGILGFSLSLFSLFIEDFRHLARDLEEIFIFGEPGLIGLILFPILGYTIVMSFKFFAELIMGIAQIARNTAK
jgi:hypothetical protein